MQQDQTDSKGYGTSSNIWQQNQIGIQASKEEKSDYKSTVDGLESLKVSDKSLRFEKIDLEYKMDYPKRGRALIFNNNKFHPKFQFPFNPSNETDCERLKKTLVNIGFEEDNIEIFNDFTRTEIWSKLKEVAKLDHSESDCILLTMLSYASNDLIFAADGYFQMSWLWEPFTADRCPTLAMKPKIFFIQTRKRPTIQKYVPGSDVVDAAKLPDNASYRIPSQADFLVVSSLITDNGPKFIQTACDVLDEYGQTEELAQIFTRVNLKFALELESEDLMKKRDSKEKPEMPCVMSMLTKKVIFKPKKNTKETEIVVSIETVV